MNKENGGVEEVEELKSTFLGDTPEARREVLMPFFWTVIAQQGQVFGSHAKNSLAEVTNGHNFSYPGYNETLCGFADPRIDSNDKRPNPNVTVFEWLHRKQGFQGRVTAIGCWDVFPYIFNTERCGFPVNAGYNPLVDSKLTPRMALLNELKVETPRKWKGEPFDSFTFHTALEHIKQHHPRVMFVSLNETDAWARGRYDEYLTAARGRSIPENPVGHVAGHSAISGQDDLIFSPDHGRGDARWSGRTTVRSSPIQSTSGWPSWALIRPPWASGRTPRW